MSIDVTVNNLVAVEKTASKPVPQKSRDPVVFTKDSFKVISKITNSTKLSDGEKSSLIGNVALVEKYAKGNLRSRMLNNITATTIFLEQNGPKRKSVPNVNQSIQQFQQATKKLPPVATKPVEVQKQVAQVQKQVESLPQQLAKATPKQVEQSVPKADVEAVFSKPVTQVAQDIKVEVKEIRQPGAAPTGEQFNIQDKVAISENARVAQELTLPGTGGGEDIQFEVLGSGEFKEIPLPGGGNTEADIQREVAARVAALETRGVEELPLPGGPVDAEAVAALIEASPNEAIESLGELVLPGGGEDNGSVNEQAAHVALSV